MPVENPQFEAPNVSDRGTFRGCMAPTAPWAAIRCKGSAELLANHLLCLCDWNGMAMEVTNWMTPSPVCIGPNDTWRPGDFAACE